ncbi:MAG: DUF3516 domain-containing protein, partial [Planctomycetota bacterium]
LVGKRLMTPAGLENANKDLNRMLITLHSGGFVDLEPPPQPANHSSTNNTGESQSKISPSQSPNHSDSSVTDAPPPTSGLFGDLLDAMKRHEEASTTSSQIDDSKPDTSSSTPTTMIANQDATSHASESVTFDVINYRPTTATPKRKLDRLVQIKSINPLWGVFIADLLASADDNERLAVLESALQVPGTVARLARVPSYDEMPAGPLARDYLDPQLLQRGLATAEELGGGDEDDNDDDVRDQGFGRVMFDEPRVWPLTIGEKCLRLFRDEFPKVDDVRVTPVWIIGELLEYGGDFDKYVTTRKLQKEEGILFRHCLRMILLLDEMANVPPRETTVETWEDWLDDLADQLSQTCRDIDPQSTDEVLFQTQSDDDDLGPRGRRNVGPVG